MSVTNRFDATLERNEAPLEKESHFDFAQKRNYRCQVRRETAADRCSFKSGFVTRMDKRKTRRAFFKCPPSLIYIASFHCEMLWLWPASGRSVVIFLPAAWWPAFCGEPALFSLRLWG